MHSGLMVTIKAPHLCLTTRNHSLVMFLTLPGMVIIIIQCHTFMDIFGPCTFHIFHSNIHSLSENESSAEGVYEVFVALQENPSLQKLE